MPTLAPVVLQSPYETGSFLLYCLQFSGQDGFIVETSSGQKFEDVDLSEGEWTEYDEKLDESVEIMSLQWRFAVHK